MNKKSLQDDFLAGSACGDLHLSKGVTGAALVITHSTAQKDYFFAKVALMEPYPHNKDIGPFTVSKAGKTYSHYRCRFGTNPDFLPVYHKFYPSGKKAMTVEVVRSLSDRSLAFWFGDDGSLDIPHKRPGRSMTARFHIGSANIDPGEASLVGGYFCERFGEVSHRTEDGIERFYFSVDASINLGKVINPTLASFFPKKMITGREVCYQ